MIEILAVLAS